MKKIKYLFGFFIFGFGLLINQSFSADIYIDTVTPLGNYNTSAPGSNYQYAFTNTIDSFSHIGFLGYSRTALGLTMTGIFKTQNSQYQSTACPSDIMSGYFNSSQFGFVPYNPSCVGEWQNVAHYTMYKLANYSYIPSGDNGVIKVLLGTNSNFGSNFVTVESTGTTPYYGFGKGFYGISDYISVSENSSNYFRFFYPYIDYGDNVYGSPVDSFNIITMSGDHQTGSYAREYFYYNGTRTNYGYIVDDGTTYTKYKHFGLFEMGYSYVYGKVNRSTQSLNRNQLGFRTVGDNVKIYLQHYGDISNSVFNDYSSGFSNISRNGLLLLRSNQYVTLGQDNGVYLLSKDVTNPSRILYEHRSCNTDNVDYLLRNATGCVKLDGGYLTYNGSTSVLPFTNFTDSYSITGLNSNFPLLYDLTNGGRGLTDVHGVNSSTTSCLYINNVDRCYGFVSNSTVDILEQYLNPSYTSSGEVNTDVISLCVNNSSFYSTNRILCENILNTIGQPVEIPGMTGCYISYTVNSSGNVITWVTCQDDFNNTGYNWVDNGSGGYWACANPNGCEDFGRNSGINFDGSGFDNTGISYLSNWFSDYFEHGFFFKCPFNYNYNHYKDLTIFGTKVFYSEIGRDFLYPIYCMGAGFRAGKDFNVFSSLTNTLPSRLLDSDKYKGLYNIFDIILSLGILFFIFKIYNLIK